MKIGQKYLIQWLDTFSFNGWWEDAELRKKAKEMSHSQDSVGIFAGEYYGWVILCTHENPHEQFSRWGHPDFIPRKCIKRIKKLHV